MMAPFRFILLLTAGLLVQASIARAEGGRKPRVIVIEPPSSPPSSPTSSTAHPPTPANELESRAQDNALLAGATEVEPALHVTGTARRAEEEISVKANHCYAVSIAWSGQYRATITYVFGLSSDDRSLNDYYTSDSGETYPGEGVTQFCVDHSGRVRLEITAEDGAAQAETRRAYTIVVGSRSETPAQREARHHRATVAKARADQAAEKERAAEDRAPAERPRANNDEPVIQVRPPPGRRPRPPPP